ncbi:MAG: hypothetical protein MRY74_01565 [Neomegalonema sp.]|nr:hypothetical protein [Neomegalonema sp.]
MRDGIAMSPRRALMVRIKHARRLVSALCGVLALTALAICAAPAANAQTTPSFADCAAIVDEAALRRDVAAGAKAAMQKAAAKLDYAQIVAKSWGSARFDKRFERIVEGKIKILRAETTYIGRLGDSNVPAYARKMAERVANLVFKSPEFAALQESLMAEIRKNLELSVGKAEATVSGAAASCVRLYLAARYAEIVGVAFADELAGAADAKILVKDKSVGGSAAIGLALILTGVLGIVFRRAIDRIIASLVKRLAGRIAARLTSGLSFITGVVVLSYELIAGADGVFPEIQETLLSEATRVEIQRSVTDELQKVSGDALDKRAASVADALIGRWEAFKRNHAEVLRIAEREPDFAKYLRTQSPQHFEKLSNLVALISAEKPGGDAAVMAALRSGVLARAMNIPKLDTQAEKRAQTGVKVSDLIAWADLAGANYPKALAYGLPSAASRTGLDGKTVEKLLALDTPAQARKIAVLKPELRSLALSLDLDILRPLARDFSTDGVLALLTVAKTTADPSARRLLMERALENPASARILADPAAAQIISNSRSPASALSVLTDAASTWNPFAFFDHVSLVAAGDVSPLALAHRYGWFGAVIIGVPLILTLGLLRSLTRATIGRRRRKES